MGTTTVTLDEYLNTSYEPDMEFVDGVLVRRNAGTPRHGYLQSLVIAYFQQFHQSHRIRAFTETRLLVDGKTSRHRIPDVMAIESSFPKGKVVVDTPAIVVEIKSPDDTFDDILDHYFDYEKLGVLNIVVLDPDNQRAWLFEHGDLRFLTGNSVSLTLRERPPIEFPFVQMFAELE
jgi:Uma2 family endonuclease